MTEPIRQKRLAREATFEGTGIHSGAPCRMAIRPAEEGSGIVLKMKGTDWPALAATSTHAVADESDRRTVMRGPDGQLFQQLEHVMAALAALGVTDVELEQEGPEPPFLGGGSFEYVEGLRSAGLEERDRQDEPLVIKGAFAVRDGDAEVVATPYDGLRLTALVDFPGTIVGTRGVSFDLTGDVFRTEVAKARTFALEADIEALRAAGLARGGNLQNAVVFNATRFLNETLFFEDEVPRHKIVDLLGDLALAGRPLRGHFWAWRAGHRSHVRFVQALLKEYVSGNV